MANYAGGWNAWELRTTWAQDRRKPDARQSASRTDFRPSRIVPVRSPKRGMRARVACYGDTHPAKFIWPFSILIMATGLIGLRSGPMEMVPETPT